MRQLIRELYPREVEFHRFETCVNYNDCLLEAGKLKWISFSCRGCEDFEDACEPEALPAYATNNANEYVYPAAEKFGGDLLKFTKKLTQKMREMGIPIRGKKE